LNYDPLNLNYLIDRFGYEKIVMGSDYPFLLREINPGKVIDETVELTEKQRKAILGGNALDFLNMKELANK
jgi:aminocarboxymuconate-semialdehyde decarboxylase